MRLLPIITAAVAALALTFASGQAADAAVVHNAINNVTVSPSSPSQNSQIKTTIGWCVPNGTKQGDTFTLTLSSHLDDLPLGFSLNDPKTGAQVATASLSTTTPAVITFTMTSYAASHLNTCGSAFLTSGFNSSTTPSGVTTPFTFTTGDGTSFSTSVTPTGQIGNRASAIKYGSFTRADDGRTVPADFLRYHIDTPVGPFDSAKVEDVVPPGQNWTFDCSSLVYAQVTDDANFNYISTATITPQAVACTPTALTVDWNAAPALTFDEVLVSVSLPANGATGLTTAPQTFTNVARVTTTLNGTPTVLFAAASNPQSSAGGVGAGTPVVVTPTPKPTPAPVPTATPTVKPVVAAAGPSDRTLAYTGSDPTVPLGIAGGALVLGAGLVLLARRRSAARPE